MNLLYNIKKKLKITYMTFDAKKYLKNNDYVITLFT